MTVRELRNRLKQEDPDMEVFIEFGGEYLREPAVTRNQATDTSEGKVLKEELSSEGTEVVVL